VKVQRESSPFPLARFIPEKSSAGGSVFFPRATKIFESLKSSESVVAKVHSDSDQLAAHRDKVGRF
jgi:hypothetical protein